MYCDDQIHSEPKQNSSQQLDNTYTQPKFNKLTYLTKFINGNKERVNNVNVFYYILFCVVTLNIQSRQ